MRAVVYDRTGGPEVLRVVDRPEPEPGPGEVLVAVVRSGVNPTDWKSRRGPEAGTRVDPPQTPNQDGSGVVRAVGQGVDAAMVGRRVWLWESAHGRPTGTAQQLTVLPVHHAVALPDSASFDLGASLGVPFLTAHRALTVTEGGPARLGPGALAGRTVLVTGGAGSVGNAAIQLARWADATVLTTVSSPEKARLAAAAGAHDIVDYTREDVVAEVRRIVPRGVDTVVDVNAVRNAAADAAVVAPDGSIAIYADDDGSEVSIPVRASMMTNARWQFVLLYTVTAAAKAAAVEDVSAAVAAGAVGVGEEHGLPLHHYSLDDAAAAHQAVQDRVVGKVLIDVAQDGPDGVDGSDAAGPR